MTNSTEAIARKLAAAGANLALAARSSDELCEVRDEMVGLGVKAIAVTCDVADPAQRRELVERTTAELGPVDVLVNNAGVETVASYLTSEPGDIERTIAVYLTAPMLLARDVLPGMVARGRGHIVNMASAAGKSGVPYGAPYSATKFGLVGMTHALRAELYGSPVGVSVVGPGFVTGAGMYARWEAQGVAGSRPLGSTSPQKVPDAGRQAIVANQAEVIVNFPPLRPVVVLEAALPALHGAVARLLGVTETFRRAGELRG